MIYHATRTRLAPAITVVGVLAAGAVGIHHFSHAVLGHHYTDNLELISILSYMSLVAIVIVPFFHRDLLPTRAAQTERLKQEIILTIIPAFNEDPLLFKACLESLVTQSRIPDRIHVVENGDPAAGYTPTLRALTEQFQRSTGLDIIYSFNPEPDKRNAQAVALRAFPQATIHMTMDSDVVCANRFTIERALCGFANRRVMSVCALLLGRNLGFDPRSRRKKIIEPETDDTRTDYLLRLVATRTGEWRRILLVRLIDIGFVGSFLNGRAAYSMTHCVAVNTGGLSFYRAKVMNHFIDHYLGHRIFGRKMAYGDDAMWTRYAMFFGRTMFQRGAVGYTLHPENMTHLLKQRARWHRSWFWGNLWLLRNQSPARLIWWITLWQFMSFTFMTFAIPAVVVIAPVYTGRFAWPFFAWLGGVAYLSALPYTSVKRDDLTDRQMVSIWLLAPLSGLLNLFIGFTLRYWGLATCLRPGWSTRQKIEVALDGNTTPAEAGADTTTLIPGQRSDSQVAYEVEILAQQPHELFDAADRDAITPPEVVPLFDEHGRHADLGLEHDHPDPDGMDVPTLQLARAPHRVFTNQINRY